MNSCHRSVSTACRSTLNASAVRQLRENFHAIDKDNTGTITFAELSEAIRSTGAEPAKVAQLMREMDSDGDGTINYEEFLVATAEVRRTACVCAYSVHACACFAFLFLHIL
jgi:calcium-dependent protein kinase